MQPAPWKTRIPAVVGVGRPYHLYPKTSVWLRVTERRRFPRVTAVPYTYAMVTLLYQMLQSALGYSAVIWRTWVMVVYESSSSAPPSVVPVKTLHSFLWAGLPWIWNFSFISISTDAIACVRLAPKFSQNTVVQGRPLPPPKKIKTYTKK